MPNVGARPMSVASLTQGSGVAGPRGNPNSGPRGPPRGPANPRPGNHNNGRAGTWGPSNRGGSRPGSSARPTFSNASRAQAPAMPAINEDTEQLPDQFASMNVGGPSGPQGRVYDPSMAPSPSEVTVQTVAHSTRRSNASGRPMRRPIKTKLCTLTGRTRDNFSTGEIITLSHHVTNCDPNIDLSDENLTLTKFGGVYSKRRMFIVLTINKESMLCIPMFTYSRTGMRKKPLTVRHEFLSMANEGDEGFLNQCVNLPIEANCRHALDKDSTIHLGDIVKVGFKENIGKGVGRVTKESYDRLVDLWRNFIDDAFKGA